MFRGEGPGFIVFTFNFVSAAVKFRGRVRQVLWGSSRGRVLLGGGWGRQGVSLHPQGVRGGVLCWWWRGKFVGRGGMMSLSILLGDRLLYSSGGVSIQKESVR